MAPKKRTTRLNPKTTTTAPATTSVTNAQLKAMIDQGVTAALATRDANTNGVESHNSGTGVRRNERATRKCTYPNFMKCQPLNFKGTEGVVELTQWVEKMEIDLKVKGTDVIGYNQHFQELALLCVRMFPEESDKIERYVDDLPGMIHGSVVASKPKTMKEATEIATELMDKRIRTFAERQTENKRKQDNNQQQQPKNKRQNTGRAYAAGTSEKKLYGGSKPLCPKCNYHHDGIPRVALTHVKWGMVERVIVLSGVAGVEVAGWFKRDSPCGVKEFKELARTVLEVVVCYCTHSPLRTNEVMKLTAVLWGC
ncbi:hypothetical protein Tco_0799509 [Tanacetum coccineum]|uniref:Reverse transcriptase domain-containing protein n=1 Tax=Tanacetum coccineum TaxID=301880 RepID=A0ABQ4ZTC7_9ASTR